MNPTTPNAISAAAANTCAQCGSTYPRAALICPHCRTLTHASALGELSAQARQKAQAGDAEAEHEILSRMQGLLPHDAPQRLAVEKRLREVAGGSRRSPMGVLAGLGALGMILWKFKFVGLFLLTKGKALLLGLTKVKTLLSMLLALGAYWTIWGWPFAIGFVLSIYIHEMGHVIALRRLGIAAEAPMFIPFVGAFVRLNQPIRSPKDDAMVGLAGPVYGLGAAVACYLLSVTLDSSLLAAIARTGAWINLFNLIPIWQLDGGRAFNSMTRQERLFVTAIVGGAWFLSGESMLLLVLLGCGYRLFVTPPATQSDRRATVTTSLLIIALSALTLIEPTLPQPPATPSQPS